MKKIIALVFCVCFTVIILVGCKETKKNGVLVKDFINEYASHSVGEDYYKYNNLDYNYLYDIEMEDGEYDGYSSYDFCLLPSLFGNTTAEMEVLVDEDDYIDAVFINFEKSILNLFETPSEYKEYYASILTSLNIGLSENDALNIIDTLWNVDNTLHNQVGIEKQLDVNEKLVIELRIYEDGKIRFQAALKR